MSENSLEVPSAVGLSATFASSWVEVIYRSLMARGLNARQVFSEVGIDKYQTGHDETRFPAHKFKYVWDRAAYLSDDPAFGLTAATVVFPTMYHSLSVSMSASGNLEDAFDRLIRYHRIIDTLSINTLVQYPSGSKMSWNPVPVYESEIGAEAYIATVVALCRWCYGPNFAPEKVTFVKEEVAAETYRGFFKCPVFFGASENAIYIDRETLQQPLPTANRQLAISSEHLVAEYLARTDSDDIVNMVYSKLLDYNASNSFSEDVIAEELCLSLRSLQRKLQQGGTSFNILLQSVRRNLALHYISDPHLSLQQVAAKVGFSNPSNFNRAFKRWTDISPGKYRQSFANPSS